MRLKTNLNIEELDGRYAAVGGADKKFNGILYINKTGKYILELLKDEISKEEIIQKLTEKYQVDRQRAAEDLEKFLEPFIPTDLIEFGADER